jgi:predicted AAA+ superfamily ATPase
LGARRTAAAENDSVIELNADCVGCERGATAVVTKLADGNEGFIQETREDMSGASCRRKRGNVEFSDVNQSDCATIREDHLDARDCRLAVYVSNVGAQKMPGAASVCNGIGRKKWRGGS